MRKFTVIIDGTQKIINLKESIAPNKDPYILLKKASLFWNYNNVDSTNNEVTYNNVKNTFPNACWTFHLIKKQMESNGTVTLQSNKYDSTCTLTTDRIINLKIFGPLLGFTANKNISANTATKSDNPVDINKGLNFIKILCSIIDRSENIFDENRSNVLVSLPITTTQSLLYIYIYIYI